MSFLPALRKVLAADHIVEPTLALTEKRAGSRCADIPVQYRGAHFAVRLRDNDHLKLLRGASDRERGSVDGYTNLPDYLVFSEAPASKKDPRPVLRVLVCELKSSDASRALARRQVQLGALIVPYLVALARLDAGLPPSTVHLCGVIAYQDLRPPQGRTRPGHIGEPEDDAPDPKVGIYVYPVPCGEPIYLDNFDYCPASS